MTRVGLRAMLAENWGLKVVSLALSVTLWLFVMGEKSSEVTLSAPLELTRVPSNLVLVSPVPPSVRVRLNGPSPLLATVSPQRLTVRLDLDGMQPGISAFEILPARLDLPRGVEVTYLSPSVITLEADQKVRRTVPLRARTRGSLADGFGLVEARVEPPTIEVEGAERSLRQLEEIRTEVVDISGLEGGVVRPVELAFPDPSVRAVERRPVRVEVVVREVRAESAFLGLPVEPPGPGWQVVPGVVDVTVEGSARTLARLQATDVSAGVEPVGDGPPKVPVRVVVRVPPGVNLKGVEPNLVQLVAPGATPPGPKRAPVRRGGEE